jgi:hypothetical protein
LYSSLDLKSLPGITKPFAKGFDPLKFSETGFSATGGSDGTLEWFQAAYVAIVPRNSHILWTFLTGHLLVCYNRPFFHV